MVASDRLALSIEQLMDLARELRRQSDSLHTELKHLSTMWDDVNRRGWERRYEHADERFRRVRKALNASSKTLKAHATEIDRRREILQVVDAASPPPAPAQPAPPPGDAAPPPAEVEPTPPPAAATPVPPEDQEPPEAEEHQPPLQQQTPTEQQQQPPQEDAGTPVDVRSAIDEAVRGAMDSWLREHGGQLAGGAAAIGGAAAMGGAAAPVAGAAPLDERAADGRASAPAEPPAGEVPRGYASPEQWQQSQAELGSALERSGLDDAQVQVGGEPPRLAAEPPRAPAEVNTWTPIGGDQPPTEHVAAVPASATPVEITQAETAPADGGGLPAFEVDLPPFELQLSSDKLWDLIHAMYPGGVDADGHSIFAAPGQLQASVVNDAFPLLAEWLRRWSELTGRLHVLLVSLTAQAT